MAQLQFEEDIVEVQDESNLKDAAESLGVPFGCRNGQCGTCTCDVVLGMDNLSPKTPSEQEMDLANNQRLLCQCKIKSGLVKINFD